MKTRLLISACISTVVLVLVLLGGNWAAASAQFTIPTAQPRRPESTPKPSSPLGESECLSGTLGKAKPLHLFFFFSRASASPARWGGVINPKGSACQAAKERFCRVPVNYLPQREQLNFYRQGAELRQYRSGVIDSSDSCAPKQLYFDLTAYERRVFDTEPEKITIFTYDPLDHAWEPCPDLSFDEKQGDHGRLSCNTSGWGYFALAWEAKK